MNRNGQLAVASEARKTKRQHKTPCADCPWARKSLAGWIGAPSVMDWLIAVHSDAVIECHTTDKQCAGAAIFRANVVKSCRTEEPLRLPEDRVLVFGSDREFQDHHNIFHKRPV